MGQRENRAVALAATSTTHNQIRLNYNCTSFSDFSISRNGMFTTTTSTTSTSIWAHRISWPPAIICAMVLGRPTRQAHRLICMMNMLRQALLFIRSSFAFSKSMARQCFGCLTAWDILFNYLLLWSLWVLSALVDILCCHAIERKSQQWNGFGLICRRTHTHIHKECHWTLRAWK